MKCLSQLSDHCAGVSTLKGFRQFIAEATVVESYVNIDPWIVQLYLSGRKIKQIEEQTGKWRSYIYEVLRKEGVLPHRLNQQRELTIQLANSGVSARKIAEITSQTERNVREIVNKNKNRQGQGHVFYEKL